MRLVLIALTVCASMGAQAENDESGDVCADWSSLAENIMRSRQAGVSMAEMMKLTKGTKPAQRMVIAAYEERRYHTEEIQQRKVEDFRDEAYLACVKTKNEGKDDV